MTRIWLSRHVHLCKVGAGIILLDLARDKYFAVNPAVAEALAERVPGWPAADGGISLRRTSVSSDEACRIIQSFITQGLLTSEEQDGKEASPPALDVRAATIALDRNVPRARSIRLSDLATFLFACVSTMWTLRVRSLRSSIDAVVERKAKSADREFDADLAADLVAIFRRLRSFAFSGERRCLFQALTLVNFLSRYQLFPDFVIGVKTDPWAAHSWVQQGPFVLDGTPEQVRFYQPILVV